MSVTSVTDSEGPLSYQITRADTRGRILDFTDTSPDPYLFVRKRDKYAPKISLNLCVYAGDDHKSTVQHRHWIDVDTLALLAWDILTNRKGEKSERGYSPILDEFKGGPAANAKIPEITDGLVSRRLTVIYNDGLNIGPVYQFRFVVTKGVEGANGQVMPVKDSKPVIDQTMNISVQEARTIALTLHMYFQAKTTIAVGRFTQCP